jgi:transposase
MVDSYQPLSDSHWQFITSQVLLPGLSRSRRHSLRAVLDAVFYLCRTGYQWRALPDSFPPWSAVCYHFRRWQQSETWQQVNEALNWADREREQRAPTPSLLCGDSQSVKLAPRIFEYRGTDGGKHVNGRKRHVLVDSGGRIWAVHVTAVNVSDSRGGVSLLAALPRQRLTTILTDANYRGCIKRTGVAVEADQSPIP